MMPEITQKNVHLFIPYKVAKLCDFLSREEDLTASEAVIRFYKSRTARLLEDESTKLWQLGWVTLYEMYKEEENE